MPEWNPLMGIGFEEIDRGHRELVERLNELGLAMKRGRGQEVVRELLAFLGAHATSHFAIEERLMERSGYPDREQHRLLHEAFRSQLAEKVEAYAADPTDPGQVLAIHGWMMTWLERHEIAADAPLGEHLRRHAPPG